MSKGGEILDKIRAHYAAGEQGASLVVPEWDCTIWRRPLTIQAKEELFKLAKGSNSELLSWAIVKLALDESGDRIFDMSARKVFLDSADGDVVAKVGNWLLLPPGQEIPLAEDVDPKN